MTNAEARFNKIHIRKVYACLAVTCHLHFWQNDRDFLRATVVTRGWNGYRNKSQHRKSTLEKKILPPFQQGFRTRDLSITSPGALTTELSPPPPPPPPPRLSGPAHNFFNTLDNWAIKTPPNQKGKGPERKGYRVMARNMYRIHSVTLLLFCNSNRT